MDPYRYLIIWPFGAGSVIINYDLDPDLDPVLFKIK